MELKDFVKQTILDIATAIQEANKEAKEQSIEAIVNPSNIVRKGDPSQYYNPRSQDRDMYQVENIEFDVAVTTSGSIEGGMKGGINVVGIELGGGGKVVDQSSKASHIKFTIPVVFPYGKM